MHRLMLTYEADWFCYFSILALTYREISMILLLRVYFIKGVFYYLKAYVKGINMALNDKIEEYLEILECSGRDLSSASGLSDAAISRYKSGSRIPAYDSQEFNALVSGFEMLFDKSGVKPPEDIREGLKNALPTPGLNREKYAERLGILTSLSEISRTKIAATAGYDPSFITRVIRGGENSFGLHQLYRQDQ